MNDIVYRPFARQVDFHQAQGDWRIRGAFAGKRGGKTECGAIEAIVFTENKIGYNPESIDEYVGVIVAPTTSMLKRLSLQKFFNYARPFNFKYNKSDCEIHWENGSIIYGISADKPQRLEGLKASWIWIDEVFQVKEQLFLEAKARISDTRGSIWCTGSLGVQYKNPKNHWAFKYFKDRPDQHTTCFEWCTADNPYFPKDELEYLRETLDPETFRQMFELNWDVTGTSAVYDQFSEANLIKNFRLEQHHEVHCCIDWGWAHNMACLFFAYDPRQDIVYLFDEIVSSRLKLETLYEQIMAKRYPIRKWICDIAGEQTREQTALSNIAWFKQRNIHFQSRRTQVSYGLPIVRSYIKNGLGQTKFYVEENHCKKSIDQIKNYSYAEKDGQIINENPIKVDDDCCDAIRYYFVNVHDPALKNRQVKTYQYI